MNLDLVLPCGQDRLHRFVKFEANSEGQMLVKSNLLYGLILNTANHVTALYAPGQSSYNLRRKVYEFELSDDIINIRLDNKKLSEEEARDINDPREGFCFKKLAHGILPCRVAVYTKEQVNLDGSLKRIEQEVQNENYTMFLREEEPLSSYTGRDNSGGGQIMPQSDKRFVLNVLSDILFPKQFVEDARGMAFAEQRKRGGQK